MSRVQWYVVAGLGAVVVLWFVFGRSATARPPIDTSAMGSGSGSAGILEQLNSGAAQVRALFGNLFGTKATQTTTVVSA